MNFSTKALLALIFSTATLNLAGQECLIGLTEHTLQRVDRASSTKSSRSGDPYLSIPFFDDFAKPGNTPNSALWIDSPVYINTSYGINPYSVGVATFDLLNSSGKLHTNAQVGQFLADSLTSHYINLKYPGNNSIFLSFQYQPAGYGDMPETPDSLVLRLYSSVSKKWIVSWSAKVHAGIIVEYNHLTSESKEIASGIDTTFHNVLLQINQPYFLADSFRIQFSNYGSLNDNSFVPGLKANADQWNLDMVYLNSGRNITDSTVNDVAFSKPLKSMLQGYESIPWKHFTPSVQASLVPNPSTLVVTYHNQGGIVWNVTRHFDITNTLTQANIHLIGGAENINPHTTTNYERLYTANFTSPSSDSAEFKLSAYLELQVETDPARKAFRWNDTIARNQVFKNYYAYDDGSVENGYGLYGEGASGAMVAMKFISLVKDTLQGIYTYFNQTHSNIPKYNSTEQLRFYLTVWSNNNGKPGEIIYQQAGEKPIYSAELNKFVYIKLNSPIVLEGTFFVGWKQVKDDMLNVGFDRNNNSNDKLFYNLSGAWEMSNLKGTLMLRPVFGSNNGSTTDIPDAPLEETIKLYPNPASSYITIESNGQTTNGLAQLYDLTGRAIMQLTYNEQIDVSGLPSGLYLVRFTNQKGKTETKKLIISR